MTVFQRLLISLVGLAQVSASGPLKGEWDVWLNETFPGMRKDEFWADVGSQCLNGPCMPGNEYCGKPFTNAPAYHLMDQHGCGENDPNGPVFDPVHGVIHHFYQIHLSAAPGHGPDYGHFVSKDFVNWAALPVAIWNGYDASVTPPRVTKYDNQAIFTGSAFVVDGAGPGGKGPGVVNIYPGLCDATDWPACKTGTLLAQAVAADYANDELLVNWTKPSYNPIMENTQRDPSSPWKTPSGEWRLRTYDSQIYGSASDADVLAGKWYHIGTNSDFRGCECPSFYPLPASTPGFEATYDAARQAGTLPTHVHKTSCGGDWWQIGTYFPAGLKQNTDHFNATPGWEDVFAQKRIDTGNFYASKDNEYPTKDGKTRRINWGWATVPPASTQTLPREITFNAAARTLEQAPLEELKALRGDAVFSKTNIQVDKSVGFGLAKGVGRQSEVVAVFTLPKTAASLSVVLGDGVTPKPVVVDTFMTSVDLAGNDYNITHYPPKTDPKVCEAACNADAKCQAWTYVVRGAPAGSGDCCLKSSVPCPGHNSICVSGSKKNQTLSNCGGSPSTIACTVDYTPPSNASAPYYEVPVSCGDAKDTLRLLPSEKTLEIRVYSDWTFVEGYFQKGRAAITRTAALNDAMDIALASTAPVTVESANAYPIKGIWTSPHEVRKAPRVYPAPARNSIEFI
jgi:sucrose-6-phosphate hydrolase SacC (GH32 family)